MKMLVIKFFEIGLSLCSEEACAMVNIDKAGALRVVVSLSRTRAYKYMYIH